MAPPPSRGRAPPLLLLSCCGLDEDMVAVDVGLLTLLNSDVSLTPTLAPRLAPARPDPRCAADD